MNELEIPIETECDYADRIFEIISDLDTIDATTVLALVTGCYSAEAGISQQKICKAVKFSHVKYSKIMQERKAK